MEIYDLCSYLTIQTVYSVYYVCELCIGIQTNPHVLHYISSKVPFGIEQLSYFGIKPLFIAIADYKSSCHSE